MDAAYLAGLPIYRLMTFMPQMQTVNTVQRHISLPTSSAREGPVNMKSTGRLLAESLEKREQYEWKVALGQKRNIMNFRRLKPGQKRMKSFGSSSGFTQQMPFG